ncbi:tyrosine-protein phosphatase [Spongiibacter sp. KMU-158]|uniref:Tyrosine-protein phosphatase n=1 Tax=Spongiibacter pelagi TaxID=2760804 RepID=A0A927C335_9GAMM|nr:tyrosine-protein phosphatase [Spongiibacter pelagi]MBD2859899.1 tyrosine-protein phosphatase [Spongiibacter pelagi]
MSYRELSKSLHDVAIASGVEDADQRPIPCQLPSAQRDALRKLPFEKMHNFRELGGLQSADGRRLRWGMIYRSDKISGLSEMDKRYLDRLQLSRIVDFRSDEERHDAPHSLPDNSVIHIEALPISVEAAEIDKMVASLKCEDTTVEDMSRYLINANREMVEQFTPVYRQWMQDLLNPDHYPQVFHCTAGKDRTGLAAALLLTALDVPKATIMDDYMATNHYTAARINAVANAIHSSSMFQVNEDVIKVLFSVQAQFIEAAFDSMKQLYGSIDAYLEMGLSFGSQQRQQLQSLLLE